MSKRGARGRTPLMVDGADEDERGSRGGTPLSVEEVGGGDRSPSRDEVDAAVHVGKSSSTRLSRMKRRLNQKTRDEDRYADVLKESGIDMADMDEAEKMELAKILLLSKSEAEQSGHVVSKAPPGGQTEHAESPESVVCLDEGLEGGEPALVNTQDMEQFEDQSVVGSQERVRSPLNHSMSQIFTQSDDETQPPSQDLFEAGEDDRTPPQSQKLSTNAACPTLLDDVTMEEEDVQTDWAGHGSHHRGDNHNRSHSETLLSPKPPPECVSVVQAVVHRSKVTDSERDSQESSDHVEKSEADSQSSEVARRKRKASNQNDLKSKQLRLDILPYEDVVQSGGSPPVNESFSLSQFILDAEKPLSAPRKNLKRRYRRHRRLTKERRFFCSEPSTEDCDRYTEVILQFLDVYRVELRAAQCGRLNHIEWGEPVKPGRHMSKTIDVKRRGRDSCYWEVSEDSDDPGEGLDNKTETHDNNGGEKTESGRCRTLRRQENESQKDKEYVPEFQTSDDDFFPDFRTFRTTRSTRSNRHFLRTPSVEEILESDWLNCKAASGSSVTQKGSGRSAKKTELSFVSKKSESTPVENKEKDSLLFKRDGKSYCRKGSKKGPTLQRHSPTFFDTDNTDDFQEEIVQLSPVKLGVDVDESTKSQGFFQRTSPLFHKSTPNKGKKSVCKTFTFASSDSGKIEVSSTVRAAGDEDLLPPTQESSNTFISAKTSPTFSKLYTSAGKTKTTSKLPEDINEESDARGSNLCSIDECPATLVDEDEIDTEPEIGKRNKKFTGKKALKSNTRSVARRKTPFPVEIEHADSESEDETIVAGGRISKRSKNTASKKLDLEKDTSKVHVVHSKQSTILDAVTSKSSPDTGEEGATRGERSDKSDRQGGSSPDIPASAVFSARKRKRSTLFSDNDESFSLGVSPDKAFPGAFESFSDASPPPISVQPELVSSSPSFSSRVNLVRPSIHAHSDSKVTKAGHARAPESRRTSGAGDDPGMVDHRTVENQPTFTRPKQGDSSTTEQEGPVEEDVPDPDSTSQGEGNSVRHAENPEEPGMACPLCGVMFSLTAIEAHASNCNGEAADETGRDDWQEALATRDTDEGEDETCYICDGVFPKGDNYRRHVDQCLAEARRQQAELEGGTRVTRGRSTRNRQPIVEAETLSDEDDDDNIRGNSKVKIKRRKVETSAAVINSEPVTEVESDEDLCFTTSESDSDEDVSNNNGVESCTPRKRVLHRKTAQSESSDVDFSKVSDSPIKTFRKIGQLDGCLIDFSNQFKKSDSVKRKSAKAKNRKRAAKKRKRKVYRKKV